MTKSQETPLRTPDNLKLHTVAWLPEGTPKAIVLLAHGIGEHSGRYLHVAEYLNRGGYAFYALDHRGHGRSEGPRAYFDSFDQPVNDLKQYFDVIRQQHPQQRIFLYGHSMGSLISLIFTLRYQNELAGLMITGNPLAVESTSSPLLVAAGGLVQRFLPRAPLPAIPNTYLSHDQAIVSGYTTDPLNYAGPVYARMGHHIVQESRKVRTRLAELTLPILIMHGLGDRICPPAASEWVYEAVRSTDKTLKQYPDLYHEIHNELDKEPVLAALLQWLDAH